MKVLNKKFLNLLSLLAIGLSITSSVSWAEGSQASEQQLGSQGSENDSPDGLPLNQGTSPSLLPSTSQANSDRAPASESSSGSQGATGSGGFSVPSDGAQTTNFHIHSTEED